MKEETLVYLEKAGKDLEGAQVLHKAGLYDNACVLSQQSIEKNLKALATECNIEVPMSHNIGLLLVLLTKNGYKPPKYITDTSSELSALYIELRYTSDTTDISNAKKYVKLANRVNNWVQKNIENSSNQEREKLSEKYKILAQKTAIVKVTADGQINKSSHFEIAVAKKVRHRDIVSTKATKFKQEIKKVSKTNQPVEPKDQAEELASDFYSNHPEFDPDNTRNIQRRAPKKAYKHMTSKPNKRIKAFA